MSQNTPTTLASRLKQKFNKEISDIIPLQADFQRRVEFRKDLESGASSEFDVQLSHEAGFSSGSGSVTLNGAVAQVSARASVVGFSHILQTQVSYDLISRANKDEKAFAKFADGKFLGMVNAMRNREEWLAINGRRGCGKIVSNTSGALVISADTFCSAFWSSQIGATFEAYDAIGGSTQHDGDLVVSAVNVSTRTVTVTGTSSSVVQDDHLFIKGQHAAGRIGLMDIAYNTGTLYGISAATYPLWSANSYDCGTSPLTLGKIVEAAGESANKGAAGEKMVCYVPAKAFQNLISDESALIRHSAGKKKFETGAEGICITSAVGEIEILPSLYMKDGEAVIYPPSWTYILGSQEATTSLAKDGDMIFDLESTSAKELRMFSDNTVFVERPGYVTYITRSDNEALHSA